MRWFLFGVFLLTLVVDTSAEQLSLTWVDGVDTDVILVERALVDTGPFTSLTGVPAGTQVYVDATLQPGDTRCYRIAGSNEVGVSPYLGPVCATVAAAPPPVGQVTLTAQKSGSSSSARAAGLIQSTPPGITCGTDCSQPYDVNTTVTLTASVTNARYRFSQWDNTPGCASSSTCVVTMTGAKTATARFVRR